MPPRTWHSTGKPGKTESSKAVTVTVVLTGEIPTDLVAIFDDLIKNNTINTVFLESLHWNSLDAWVKIPVLCRRL